MGVDFDKEQDGKGSVRIDNIDIETTIREYHSFTEIGVEVGTNGLQGGDSGHGSRTYIRIYDIGSSFDLNYSLKKHEYDRKEMIVEAGGDDELETLADAFRFIAEQLEAKIKSTKNMDKL